MTKPRLVVAGGGTGGHLFPGIAVAREMEKIAPLDVHFIGTSRGVEARVVPREGYTLHFVHAEGFRGRGVKSIRALLRSILGFIQSFKLMKRLRPSLVLGVGGYASLPPGLAAATARMHLLLHEQNIYLGLSNRLLLPFSTKILLSYDESLAYFKSDKAIVSGNPIRMELLEGERNPARFGIPDGRKVVFIFGGSQGSRLINRCLMEDLSLLTPYRDELAFIHQTGEVSREEVKKHYEANGFSAHVASFIYEMPHAYATADLVVCRAGATTLAELTALGKPSVLIPFSQAVGGHQEKNARALEERGGAVVVTERELLPGLLGEKIPSLIFDDGKLAKMAEKAKEMGKPRAAEVIAKICWEVIGV